LFFENNELSEEFSLALTPLPREDADGVSPLPPLRRRWIDIPSMVFYNLLLSLELYSLTQRGIDVITLCRIADSIRFSEDMINDNDMEFAVKTSQKQYMLMRPRAKTRGTSIRKILRQAPNL
jgi:hypothetical protein